MLTVVDAQAPNQYTNVGDYLSSSPRGITVMQRALAAANLTSPVSRFNGTILVPTDTVSSLIMWM
jgi:hypothetical protein